MEIFDNFIETNYPDNRIEFQCDCDDQDEVIIGATCTHVFKLPFIYSEYAVDCRIIYKQGLTVLFEKFPQDCEILENTERGITIMSLVLNPSDTKLFKDSVLDAFVQLKFYTQEGEILYNTPAKLVVRSTLEV